MDSNHFAFLLTGSSLADAGTAYLRGIWEGRPEGSFSVPKVRPIVLKFGWLYEFSGNSSPDVQLQLLRFGSRPDHLSLVNLNLGESGRGPFAGLAVTATPYIDLGVLQRITGRRSSPTPRSTLFSETRRRLDKEQEEGYTDAAQSAAD